MNNPWIIAIVVFFSVLILPVLLSYAVESLRSAPDAPTRLGWDPQIPIRFVDVDGIRLRYITTGQGPPMVLLHTLRTQLDMFQKMIGTLSQHFTVYALDYPGHGFADIPKVAYTPQLFAQTVSGFLDTLSIKQATIAGESIGGPIALLLAAKQDPGVKRVIAINPYDYDRGRGVWRSSWLARLLFSLNNVPVLGATFWRLRTLFAFRLIMQGGVTNHDALPSALLREIYEVGNRSHHYQAFMSLIRHFPEWEQARSEYGKIEAPVLLIYGEQDWSHPDERKHTRQLIPNSEIATVKLAGHFLSLDAPDDVVRLILTFSEKASES